jgi:outer membrane protein OmpA-like peptidoglycan-associated protein
MKQAIFVLACTASLFAQAVDVSLDAKVSCRASFDEVKNSPRDAAADRTYALVESRIRTLETAFPKEKRKGDQYEAELKTCDLSVDLFRAQLEKVALTQKYIDTQKEASLVKDSLIALWVGDAKALDASLARLSNESKRALAEKDNLLNKQKEEANKKLEALQSKSISVSKDARGTILSLSDILFETAKADLKQELKENLAEIAGILKSLLIDASVVIEGHTDNVGKATANQTLSNQRALAVSRYLSDRGVAKGRLRAIGYGASKPVADNATDEGKAKNRRVELVIKDK